jgi:hypothetical protein
VAVRIDTIPKDDHPLPPVSSSRPQTYRVYQLAVRSEVPLPAPPVAVEAVHVEVLRAAPGEPFPFEPSQATCVYRRSSGAAAKAIEFHRQESWSCLRYEAVDFFLRDAGLVFCFPRQDAPPDLLAALFLGAVCALILELRGAICLHAGAVEMKGGAVGFLGRSGIGKSSLTASLIHQGHRLVSDDILPVMDEAGRLLAVPSFPQVKLRREAAEMLFDGGTDASPALQKHLVSVDQGWGAFAPHPLPLRALYVLHRHEHAQAAIAIEPLAAGQRLTALLGHSFCARVAGPLGLAPRRFEALGEIARRIPVRRLIVPNNVRRLPDIGELLRRDLGF